MSSADSVLIFDVRCGPMSFGRLEFPVSTIISCRRLVQIFELSGTSTKSSILAGKLKLYMEYEPAPLEIYSFDRDFGLEKTASKVKLFLFPFSFFLFPFSLFLSSAFDFSHILTPIIVLKLYCLICC